MTDTPCSLWGCRLIGAFIHGKRWQSPVACLRQCDLAQTHPLAAPPSILRLPSGDSLSDTAWTACLVRETDRGAASRAGDDCEGAQAQIAGVLIPPFNCAGSPGIESTENERF